MSETAPVTALKLPEAELDLELRDYFRNCDENSALYRMSSQPMRSIIRN